MAPNNLGNAYSSEQVLDRILYYEGKTAEVERFAQGLPLMTRHVFKLIRHYLQEIQMLRGKDLLLEETEIREAAQEILDRIDGRIRRAQEVVALRHAAPEKNKDS